MPKELTEEEILSNDKDPMEAIAEIRRAEGVPEEDLPIIETPSSESSDQAEEIPDGQDELDNLDEDKPIEENLADKQAEEDDKPEKDELAEAEADQATDTEKDDGPDKDEEKEEPVGKTTFRANGQEFEFTDTEIKEQFEVVFGQAMNYTKKMQQIAPYRKMISALESEGVSSEQLNTAIDALKGNKQAIQKLLDTNKIDAFDLSDDGDEKDPYQPTDYGKNETELGIQEVVNTISSDPEYKITVDVIDNQWDQTSRDTCSSNPQVIQGLHNDIKSGMYDKVAPVAMKMKVLDGNRKSDIDYYILAGQQVTEQEQQNTANAETVNNANDKTQDAENEFDQASSEANNKRAASPTRTRADTKGVIDYLDDDDVDFDAWYKNLEASN